MYYGDQWPQLALQKAGMEQADARDECDTRMWGMNETNISFWYDALQTILPDGEAAVFIDAYRADIVTRQERKTLDWDEIIAKETRQLLGNPDYRLRMGW